MLYNIPYHEIDAVKRSSEQDIVNKVNELFYYLQVDQKAQELEVDRAFIRQKRYTTKSAFYRSIIDVLIGSLYENDVATILQSYQLKPEFSNTVGKVINFTYYDKMKNADVIVKSLKDNLLYGFDVKFGTIWRKDTNSKNIYVTNSGIYQWKLKELYDDFRKKLQKDYKTPLKKIYLLLVCYDMLPQVNFMGQSSIYQTVFKRMPNHIEKVMFVVDVDKLFIKNDDPENLLGYSFDKKSPYLIDNYLSTGQDYYAKSSGHQYSIKINSDIAEPFDQFIQNHLIINEVEDW